MMKIGEEQQVCTFAENIIHHIGQQFFCVESFIFDML
jgi:hypothetical protein